MYVLIVGFLHRHTDGSYAPPPFTHTRFDDFQVYENNYVLSAWTEYWNAFWECQIINFEISNHNNIMIMHRYTWNMVHDIVFCIGIAFWCVAFEWWLHIYATKISLFACLILRYTCMFFQDPATTIRLYMYETMIWSQNKVVSWCVNFFGTHHHSYYSCVILHHIYPIIVYTLILHCSEGKGGWQARVGVFYQKRIKKD